MSFSIGYSESPLPPPHFRYEVSGSIICDTIPDKRDYTVQLFGLSKYYTSTYQSLNGLLVDFERPLALTDSTGCYHLIANDAELFDSIKVGIVFPGDLRVFSMPYAVDSSKLSPVYEFFNKSESGCNTCSAVEPNTERRIVRYNYHLYDTEIFLCK